MAATLPLTVSVGKQQVAVVATAKSPNPSLLQRVERRHARRARAGLSDADRLGDRADRLAPRPQARTVDRSAHAAAKSPRADGGPAARLPDRAARTKPAYLWFFDLNGFKRYNDSFGHVAGDTLLTRLGGRLRDTIKPYGHVYRLGGDEFCALITAPIDDPHALFQGARAVADRTRRRLHRERLGRGGRAARAKPASRPQALRLADQRMYRQKATSHTGAAELITSVLHAALAQRHPDLGEHSDDVAGDVELLARTIGLDRTTRSTW